MGAQPGVILATLRRGAFFGEVAIMVKDVRRTAMVRASTFCDMAVLCHEDFESVMMHFPQDAHTIREHVKKQISGFEGEEARKAGRALHRIMTEASMKKHGGDGEDDEPP